MCGVIGYTGKKPAVPFLFEALELLEYGGYDSAGIAVLDDKITTVKAKGRIASLREKISGGLSGTTGIGHTRWATHGVPSDKNAHPHTSRNNRFALVHNGIIENYIELKEFLTGRSFVFAGETDTEVIVHLIDYYYNGDVIEAMAKTAGRLRGSYSVAVLCDQSPGIIYAMRKDSPMVVGAYEGAATVASDMSALLSYTRDFIIPDDGEIAILSPDGCKVVNFNGDEVQKELVHADWDAAAAQKTGFDHFMLKEIHEQPKACADTAASLKRTLDDLKTLKKVKRINIIACGSAYHAGLSGKYFIEKNARIPVDYDVASEYRYKDPIIEDGTLTVAISQSGETADTIAAIKEAQKASPVLSVVNVLGSTVARISDEVIYTLAGPEIAVATTKAYICQAQVLWLLGLYLAGKPLTLLDGLPNDIEEVLHGKEQLRCLAAEFYQINSAFFIGRGIDSAVAMEGALKLKEISYIHAQSYAAGELKHGTISLIEDGTLVVAICTDKSLTEKTLANIIEVKTRGARVLAVTCFDEIAAASDFSVKIKEGVTSPMLAAVSLQLFAYYMSLARGCDIDKPRNLAKSVTVE